MSDYQTTADGERKPRNPKLVAIEAIQTSVTNHRNNHANWHPSSSASTTSDMIDDGLTEEVWSSPVADDYRGKISATVATSDTILEGLEQDLSSAANSIIDSGLEYVEPDSPESRWPNS